MSVVQHYEGTAPATVLNIIRPVLAAFHACYSNFNLLRREAPSSWLAETACHTSQRYLRWGRRRCRATFLDSNHSIDRFRVSTQRLVSQPEPDLHHGRTAATSLLLLIPCCHPVASWVPLLSKIVALCSHSFTTHCNAQNTALNRSLVFRHTSALEAANLSAYPSPSPISTSFSS